MAVKSLNSPTAPVRETYRAWTLVARYFYSTGSDFGQKHLMTAWSFGKLLMRLRLIDSM